MKRWWGVIAAAVALAVAPCAAHAQDRGAVLSPPEAAATAPAPVLYSASHALVIGIDAYRSPGWRRLTNAVADAEAVARALKERHGFAEANVLLRKDLDGAGLEKELRDFFITRGADPKARLVLWFAGHGHTVDPGKPSEEGYLVPADAAGPADETAFTRSALPMSTFGTLMRQARAKHVLAIFDACFAGTIFDTSRDASPPPLITRATDLTVRQMIASGSKNERVADDGVFRRLVLGALAGEEASADANHDGFITGSELGLFLHQKLGNLTARASVRQTPQWGKLNRQGYDQGDVVFKVAGGTAVPTSVAASSSSPPVPTSSAKPTSANPAGAAKEPSGAGESWTTSTKAPSAASTVPAPDAAADPPFGLKAVPPPKATLTALRKLLERAESVEPRDTYVGTRKCASDAELQALYRIRSRISQFVHPNESAYRDIKDFEPITAVRQATVWAGWAAALALDKGAALRVLKEPDTGALIKALLTYREKVVGTKDWVRKFEDMHRLNVTLPGHFQNRFLERPLLPAAKGQEVFAGYDREAPTQFYKRGFPQPANTCLKDPGEHQVSIDDWLYSFWLRRHKEGTMEVSHKILLWLQRLAG